MSVAAVIGLLIIQSNLFDLSVCFSHFLGPELKRKFCEVTANGEMLFNCQRFIERTTHRLEANREVCCQIR